MTEWIVVNSSRLRIGFVIRVYGELRVGNGGNSVSGGVVGAVQLPSSEWGRYQCV